MAKKQIYKTIIQLEILSEECIPDGTGIETIVHEMFEGDYSGESDWKETNTPIVGKEATKAIIAQGSNPEFFNMDNDGNEIDF